jgi:hypothetical protein
MNKKVSDWVEREARLRVQLAADKESGRAATRALYELAEHTPTAPQVRSVYSPLVCMRLYSTTELHTREPGK